jgi:transcriptional regulator GlxA family with amidase domain
MEKINIVFLVLPRVHLLDLAGPLQVFHEAIDFGAPIRISYCTIEGAELQAASGFPLGKLKVFNKMNLRAGDYLFVPGTEVDYLLSSQLKKERALLEWVNQVHERGAHICSVCTGAFFLALAGLLDGRKCTTHWKHTAQLKSVFPQVQLQEDILFTEDNRVYTSAGVAAGIDLALHIVAKLMGDNISFKVARELVIYVRRNGAERQESIFMRYRNHIHAGIHRVQDYLQEHIQKGATLATLSEVACMSTRSLTRTV